MTTQRKIFQQQIQQVQLENFHLLALAIFQYQAKHNSLYRQYLSLINVNPTTVTTLEAIPFLPISFFKTHDVRTIDSSPMTIASQRATIFSSSGTTGTTTSRHYVQDLAFYQSNTVLGFETFYGPIANYCILGLLPSYLERSGSSLVAMVDHFIQLSKHSKSGFFLYDHATLATVLKACQEAKQPTLLIGVSFALLDFATAYAMDLSGITIMETGGMKGRRKEITRQELHAILKTAFHVDAIHSEYGMTELLSQGYSKGGGIFHPTPTMKVLTREITDPFSHQKNAKTGVLNIIDLANLDSCSFIATDDLGKVYADGSFEILGRLDSSDVRGCNLMVL